MWVLMRVAQSLTSKAGRMRVTASAAGAPSRGASAFTSAIEVTDTPPPPRPPPPAPAPAPRPSSGLASHAAAAASRPTSLSLATTSTGGTTTHDSMSGRASAPRESAHAAHAPLRRVIRARSVGADAGDASANWPWHAKRSRWASKRRLTAVTTATSSPSSAATAALVSTGHWLGVPRGGGAPLSASTAASSASAPFSIAPMRRAPSASHRSRAPTKGQKSSSS